MAFFRGCGAAFLVGVLGLGCAQIEHFPPAPECEGKGCSTNPAGGSTPTTVGVGSSGVGGGSTGNSNVSGTVHRITNPSFDDFDSPFTGTGTVLALPTSAASISSPYGGTSGTSFALAGVPSGPTWFLVQDGSNGGAGVLSTFSTLDLPALGSVALPVIDLDTMQNIASNLPSIAATGVSTLASQIILVLTNSAGPYKGLAVTGGGAGAHVIYDTGPGTYTDSGTATGSGGTIILFNATLTGSSLVLLTDSSAMRTFQVPVQGAAGAATIVRMELNNN